MKLFTKDIDKKLFAQYTKGSDLANQMVVAKIFNPYGRGTWYIINSDPDDPDYLWAIVDLMDVEVGSVSRSELESILVPPFRLNLERDTSFSPTNALELYNGLRSGKMYQTGGTADSAMSNDPMIGGTMASSMKNGGGVGKKGEIKYGDLIVGNDYFQVTRPDLGIEKINITEKGNGTYTYKSDRRSDETYVTKYQGKYTDNESLYGIFENKDEAKQMAINLLAEKMSKYAEGGNLESENAQMVANNVKQIAHHTKEMADALKGADHVPAWVVSKVYRAASDLSDATHYMEGENSKMAEGGNVFVSDVAIVPDKDGNNYLFPNPTDVNATGMMMEQGGDVYSYDTQDGEFMAKGGNIKQIPVGEEYRYKPSNSIESDIMAKVSQQMSGLRFAGNLYIKGFSGDVYLYFLDSYDRDFVSNIGIKPNERIYRYVTRATAIGGMIPLLKVNLDSGLVYFNEASEFGDESVVFSKKGVKAEYINLVRASEEDYYANGGSIGFIPMDLEEKLAITARWGGTDIKGVIGFLNAMIDSGVTDEDLKPKPTKNTTFQYERAVEKKIQEIWNRIEPNYKGGLKGNWYYPTIRRLVQRANTDDNILARFKPFRKYQVDSFANGGGVGDDVGLSKADMVFIDNMELWVIGSDKVPSQKEEAIQYATSKAKKIDSNFNPSRLLGTSKWYANGGGVGKFFSKAKELGKKGYEKSKAYTKEKVKEQKRKIAVDVINDTDNRTSGKANKDTLDKARQLVIRNYEKGGVAGDEFSQQDFDKLKKGDEIMITYESGISRSNNVSLQVKSKTIVGKGKSYQSEKITFINKENPTGVKYYAYKRANGNVGFAIGDMAIWGVQQTNKMAEGGATPAQQRKIGKVMREWKAGELNIGKSDKKVKSQKQAVAIALSQAGLSKKEEGGKMMGWKHKRK